MFNMENFGNWLLNVLREREMSQSELARVAGISKGTVSNLINGTSGIGQDSLLAIARALRLPPETVFRAAGIFPPATNDPWADEMSHKLSALDETRKNVASKVLDALLDEQEKEQAAKQKIR